MLTVYFPSILTSTAMSSPQFESKGTTWLADVSYQYETTYAAVLSYKFTDEKPDNLQVHRQEARWCGRGTVISSTSWASPLSELKPGEAPRARRQSWGSHVSRCILAGPLLMTIKSKSKTNFSLLFFSLSFLFLFYSSLLASVTIYFICHACINISFFIMLWVCMYD